MTKHLDSAFPLSFPSPRNFTYKYQHLISKFAAVTLSTLEPELCSRSWFKISSYLLKMKIEWSLKQDINHIFHCCCKFDLSKVSVNI